MEPAALADTDRHDCGCRIIGWACFSRPASAAPSTGPAAASPLRDNETPVDRAPTYTGPRQRPVLRQLPERTATVWASKRLDEILVTGVEPLKDDAAVQRSHAA